MYPKEKTRNIQSSCFVKKLIVYHLVLLCFGLWLRTAMCVLLLLFWWSDLIFSSVLASLMSVLKLSCQLTVINRETDKDVDIDIFYCFKPIGYSRGARTYSNLVTYPNIYNFHSQFTCILRHWYTLIQRHTRKYCKAGHPLPHNCNTYHLYPTTLTRIPTLTQHSTSAFLIHSFTSTSSSIITLQPILSLGQLPQTVHYQAMFFNIKNIKSSNCLNT